MKDLVFPGNLQEIMNRVLAAERLAEAQLVEARTKAEREALEARAKAETERVAARSRREATRSSAEAEAEAQRIRAEAEVDGAAAARRRPPTAYAEHPALLRLRELETLRALATQRRGPALHRLRQAHGAAVRGVGLRSGPYEYQPRHRDRRQLDRAGAGRQPARLGEGVGGRRGEGLGA